MPVTAFAVDPFVKPRYRVVYSVKLLLLIKYVLYVSNYNCRQICLLRTLMTGEMCKLRSMIRAIHGELGDKRNNLTVNTFITSSILGSAT